MQPSFFDYVLEYKGCKRSSKFLNEMKPLIPYDRIEKLLVDKNIYKPNQGKQGRPSIPVNIPIGALFLQSWYGLSDPMTEELIHDRISFRKFLDIKDEDTIPDETTICKFRNALIKENLLSDIFETVKSSMKASNLRVMNYAETKYLGLHKNSQYHYLLAAAYNLRRAPNLMRKAAKIGMIGLK